jgi:hypothetical protein
MITHFKIFEDAVMSLFGDGDYVLLYSDYYLNDERQSEQRCEIVDLYYEEDDGWQYDVVLVNSTLKLGIQEFGIERKLTDKEIKQIEIEKETNKYNL